MSWLTVLAVAICLVPGLLSWLTSIRLARFRDDPALPERLQARGVLLTWVTFVVLVSLGFLPGSLVWKIPLAILSLIIGGFPARRRVFGEQWGLGAYLLFLVRFVGAFWGFWLLLALSPVFVLHAGTWRWALASVLAAALLAQIIFYPAVSVWIVGGRPFSPPPLFDRITQLSRIQPPLLVNVVDPGGRFAYALALPSLWRPTVALTSTLLTTFAAEEQAAVYAHEVAHLEDATRVGLSCLRLSQATVVLLGTFIPAALPASSIAVFMPVVLGLMIFLWLAYVHAGSRAREERSDRRAVELCGDPEALVRALVKLHSSARLPRRWDFDVERESTHPSLARRIQAIRGLAGQTPTPMGAVAFPLTLPGEFVIFGPDRVAWLEGVTPGTPVDAERLRAQASRAQEISYKELVELRVKAGMWGAPRIVVTDKTGQVHTLPVRPEDLWGIQGVLDRADLHLASLPPPLRFELLLVRLLLAGLLVFVTWAPHPGDVIIASVCLAIFLPVPTSLSMLTAASAAHALAVLLSSPDVRHAMIGLGLVGVAIAVMWEARRLARMAVYRSRVSSVVVPLVLGGLILIVAWAWTYVDSEYYLIFSHGRLLSFVIAKHPEVWIAALALAGGLLSVRKRWTTVAGFLALACAVAAVVLAKGRVI